MYKAEKRAAADLRRIQPVLRDEAQLKDEWVILADLIDWAAVEAEYSALFPSRRGRPAVSARQALGALVIQKRMQLSDRDLVGEIARNVSYQYFIGLQTYQTRCPFQHGVVPKPAQASRQGLPRQGQRDLPQEREVRRPAPFVGDVPAERRNDARRPAN